MKLWLNLWRVPRPPAPYEVTVHASEEDAVESVVDDIEDDASTYACTIYVDPVSPEPARRLDLSDAAHELVEDRRIERETAAAEGRMLRWRQAGT